MNSKKKVAKKKSNNSSMLNINSLKANLKANLKISEGTLHCYK